MSFLANRLPGGSVLSVANYRLFVLGQLVSNAGTWMQRVAQVWLVLELSGNSGVALGVTSLLQAVPLLTLGPWGGVVADRYRKRTVLMATQVALTVLAGALGLLVLTEVVQAWHVYLFAFALGCVSVFDQPARQSFVIEMVGREQVPDAVALNSIVYNAGRVLGPGSAGVVIGWAGIWSVFLVDAVSYLASLGALLGMRTTQLHPPDQLARGPRQLRIGVHHVLERPNLLLPVVLVAVTSTFGQTFQVVLPLLVKQDLGGDAAQYGLVSAAVAVGGVLGGVVTARHRRPRVRFLLASAAVFGTALVATALVPSYWWCLVAVLPVGAAMLVVNVTANSSVQLGADAGLRGRVMGLFMTVSLAGTSLGGLLAGALAGSTGAGPTFAIGGALVVLGTGACALYVARRYRVPLSRLLDNPVERSPVPITTPSGQ